MNSYVPINVVDNIDEETLLKFKCIVSTNISLEEQVKINNITHANNIGYINADIKGLFGQIFVDFGDKFTVIDQTGEEPLSGIVSDIEKMVQLQCWMIIDTVYKMAIMSSLPKLRGMPKLNEGNPHKVEVLGPYAFKIKIDESYGEYVKGIIHPS